MEKPDKLIDEDQMVDIIYDLAVLEAIRNTDPASLEQRNIVSHEYIYTKFKIDSLQFAQSNRYYASDIHNYLKLYERVAKRLETHKTQLDSLAAKAQKNQKTPVPEASKTQNKLTDSTRVKKKINRKLSLDVKN